MTNVFPTDMAPLSAVHCRNTERESSEEPCFHLGIGENAITSWFHKQLVDVWLRKKRLFIAGMGFYEGSLQTYDVGWSYYWNQLQRISVAQLTAAGRSWMWFFFPFGWLKSKHSTESWSMKSRMGCFYTSLGGVDLIWNPHDLFNVLSPSSRNFYFFSSGVSLQPIVRSAVEIQTLLSSVQW